MLTGDECNKWKNGNNRGKIFITDDASLSDHIAAKGDGGSCGGVYVSDAGSYLCNDKGRYVFLSNNVGTQNRNKMKLTELMAFDSPHLPVE
jgi:hypothetical protein